MDIINEVKTDAQMLYTKKDVIALLEKMQEQTIDKAQLWAEDWFCNGEEWMRRTDFIEGIKNDIKQAMKGE